MPELAYGLSVWRPVARDEAKGDRRCATRRVSMG